MRFFLTSCLSAVVVAVGAPSQTTYLVGPTAIPQIRDAIALAAPGDVIEVEPGTYWPFHCKKALTIRAVTPGTVSVGFDAQSLAPFETLIAAPGPQEMFLVGIEFLPSQLSFPSPTYHSLQVFDGIITLDQCTLRGAGPSALTVSNAEVHLQDCVVESVSTQGTALAVEASFSRLTCASAEFYGGPSATAGAARHALWLNSSLLHGAGFVARGGSSATEGSTAVQGSLGSFWACDAILEGGLGACAFGGGGAPRYSRCLVIDNGTSCPTAGPGDELLGVQRSGPLQIGQPFTLTFQTAPFDFVVVVANTDLAQQSIAQLEQPLVVGLTGLVNGGFVVSGAAGVATAQWQTPGRAPRWWTTTCGSRARARLTFPLQLSPVCRWPDPSLIAPGARTTIRRCDPPPAPVLPLPGRRLLHRRRRARRRSRSPSATVDPLDDSDCNLETVLDPNKPGAPGNLIPSPRNPNGDSELAVLMRLFVDNLRDAKLLIEAGEKVPPLFPTHRTMRCAWPTNPAERDEALRCAGRRPTSAWCACSTRSASEGHLQR